MKKLLVLLVAVVLVGCEQGYNPIAVTSNYDTTEAVVVDTQETTEDTKMVKMLAPIDESIVYIWAEDTQRAYYMHELPDGEDSNLPAKITPHPFLYDDGTIAEVTDMEFYRPDRHWYFKVRSTEGIFENGVIIGWENKTRIFRQIDGEMEECPEGTVFPAYDPIKITKLDHPMYFIGENFYKWCTIFPYDDNDGKTSFCSPELKYISYTHQSGETFWVVAERRDVDHPQLFAMYDKSCMMTRWMVYAKVVYKPVSK